MTDEEITEAFKEEKFFTAAGCAITIKVHPTEGSYLQLIFDTYKPNHLIVNEDAIERLINKLVKVKVARLARDAHDVKI